MNETPKNTIIELTADQRKFFATHQTKDIIFRIEQLKSLGNSIEKHEKSIYAALWKDLHKSEEEAFLTEVSIVLSDIKYHIRNLKTWAKPQKVSTPLHLLPSKSRIIYEPLGVSLLIAPWNYPFQLLMNPLVGAISSGCTALLKTSPGAPEIAKVMQQIIEDVFPKEYIAVIHGSRETNEILLAQRFDLIFFTGSPGLGKVVMKAASEFLTPVILELGGKSPCIVDKSANLDIAARRVIWGKTINAGQTCIAPDYLLIHRDIKQEFIQKVKEELVKMFGEDSKKSNYYGRIITDEAFERLEKLLQNGDVVIGGETDKNEKYIAPTLLDNISPDDDIMQEEIFGPILPVMDFTGIDEVVDYINSNEKPLAMYIFAEDKAVTRELLSKTSSGGICVNDALMHAANHHLPFGGVGNSGMGCYHGKESFLAFSHKRAMIISPTWIDLKMKYAPFKNLSKFKRFMK